MDVDVWLFRVGETRVGLPLGDVERDRGEPGCHIFIWGYGTYGLVDEVLLKKIDNTKGGRTQPNKQSVHPILMYTIHKRHILFNVIFLPPDLHLLAPVVYIFLAPN